MATIKQIMNFANPESSFKWYDGQNSNFQDYLHVDEVNNQLYYDYGDKNCTVGTFSRFEVTFDKYNTVYLKMGLTIKCAKTELVIIGPDNIKHEIRATDWQSFEFNVPTTAYGAAQIQIKPKYVSSLGPGTEVYIKDVYIVRSAYFESFPIKENIKRINTDSRTLRLKEKLIIPDANALNLKEYIGNYPGEESLLLNERITNSGSDQLYLTEIIKVNPSDPSGSSLLLLRETIPAGLGLIEKVCIAPTYTKDYVNFKYPEDDNSPITWKATTSYVQVTPEQIVFEPGINDWNNNAKFIFTYPYDSFSHVIGFNLYASTMLDKVAIRINQKTVFEAAGPLETTYFEFPIAPKTNQDTTLEIEFDYRRGAYLRISKMFSMTTSNKLLLFENVERHRKELALLETIKTGAMFRIRERILSSEQHFDKNHLLTKQMIRNFGLDARAIYLDEYVIAKSDKSKLRLQEKTYESAYSGVDGKVLIEIIKAPK